MQEHVIASSLVYQDVVGLGQQNSVATTKSARKQIVCASSGQMAE